jgi:hypothetical protein
MQMRVLIVVAAVLAFPALATQATPDEPKAKSSVEDPLHPWHPREVAAGQFEKLQKEAAKGSGFTYTRVEYAGKAFWVVDVHYGDGVPYKSIAVYAPEKGGSFRRCLEADSNQAGWLAVTVDPKSGMLELRERANSELQGEVVLSSNLKTVGTPYSTGVTR